jgi:hypothetical protein
MLFGPPPRVKSVSFPPSVKFESGNNISGLGRQKEELFYVTLVLHIFGPKRSF